MSVGVSFEHSWPHCSELLPAGSWALAVESMKRSQGPWHTIATASSKPLPPRASAALPYSRTEGFVEKAPGAVDDRRHILPESLLTVSAGPLSCYK